MSGIPSGLDPVNDSENRYHAASREAVDALLAAEGMSTGLDVWANLCDAYIEHYLGGDADLGYAQLFSFVAAVRAGGYTGTEHRQDG